MRSTLLAIILTLMVLAQSAQALDISIDQSEYMVTPSVNDVKAGDVINVFVILKVTDGEIDGNLTTVLLVDGNERFYNNVTERIGANQTKGLWYAVVLTAGNFTLTVDVDHTDHYAEMSELNNDLVIELYVMAWNDTEDPIDKDGTSGTEESPFEYIPYIMIALIVLVVALTGLAIYTFDKRRKEQEEEMDRLYQR